MGRTIVASVVFLFAVGLLAGAFFMTRSTLALRATGLRAEGTVVGFDTETKTETRRDSNRIEYRKTTTMYKPIVEFTTASGQPIRFSSSVSSTSPGYERGAKVTVLYSETSPQSARLDSFASNWLGPLVLGGMGSVFLLVSAVLVFGPRG